MASKIWDLAREAAAVRLQLAAVNATDWQLTPKAYYFDALSVVGASEKEVARIEKAMSEPQHQAVLASAFRLTCKQIRDFKRSSAPRHVRHCIDAAADAALARIGATRESFAAACAKHMAETSPELFGALTSVADLQAKGTKLEAELRRLYAEIMTAWHASDFELVPSPRLADRKVCLVVRGTDGAVTLTADLAQHLTAYVERQSAVKAA